MKAYHFVGETLRDGGPIPADGEWLVHAGEIIPCKSGLHASVEPFDALTHAPGSTLCLVALEGDLVAHGNDKWVGRRRKILKRFDATYLLRRFAADQALSVKHLWDMPTIVEEYLTTLDATKRDAAYAAAYGAQAAANAAYAAAVYADAWVAARAAARNAAYAAAVYADAWVAALDAARSDFNKRIEKELKENENANLPKSECD